MAYATDRLHHPHGNSWQVWLAALFSGRSGSVRRRPQLDPRTLSDHLKRDMGLLDGNDPTGRHE